MKVEQEWRPISEKKRRRREAHDINLVGVDSDQLLYKYAYSHRKRMRQRSSLIRGKTLPLVAPLSISNEGCG